MSVPDARKRPIRIRTDLKLLCVKASHLLDGTIHGYWFDEQPVTQGGDDPYVPPDSFPQTGIPVFTPRATRLVGIDSAGGGDGDFRRVEYNIVFNSEPPRSGSSVYLGLEQGTTYDPDPYVGSGVTPFLTINISGPLFDDLSLFGDDLADAAGLSLSLPPTPGQIIQYLIDHYVGPGSPPTEAQFDINLVSDIVALKNPKVAGASTAATILGALGL